MKICGCCYVETASESEQDWYAFTLLAASPRTVPFINVPHLRRPDSQRQNRFCYATDVHLCWCAGVGDLIANASHHSKIFHNLSIFSSLNIHHLRTQTLIILLTQLLTFNAIINLILKIILYFYSFLITIMYQLIIVTYAMYHLFV